MPLCEGTALEIFKKLLEPINKVIFFWLSSFPKKYRKSIYYRNRYFNVKGITVQSLFSLELQKVFIELYISTPKSQRLQKNEAIKYPYDSRWNIWELFKNSNPARRNLVIIGKPGCGKTTLLQNIAMKIAAQEDVPETFKHCFPLQISIRKCAESLSKTDQAQPTLAEIFMEEYKDLLPPEHWFQKMLTQYGKRCVILLDGMDEVAEARLRLKVAGWIEQQMEKYPESRFIITSRPHGYSSNMIQNANLFEIEDFTYEQVNDFVHRWYLASEIAATGRNDAGIRKTAEDNAKDLFQRIFQSAVLSRLAINPLLLTMITMVHRYKAKLPELRAALYEDIITVLSGRRQETVINKVSVNIFQKRAVLQLLAYNMMLRNLREISTADANQLISASLERIGLARNDFALFLETMMNETGLLVEPEPGKISFAHLTYQEYLTATEIKRLQTEEILKKNLGNPWWNETILLYTAISDATNLVQACLAEQVRRIELLKLAYEILQEAMQIAPDERKQLENELVIQAESDNEARRQVATDLMFEIRMKRRVRIKTGFEVDPYFISQIEYQDFIIQTDLRPDHWRGQRFASGDSLIPIVGIRKSDAEEYARWLTQKAQISGYRDTYFRLATLEESRQVIIREDMGDKNFSRLARTNLGTWVQDQNALCFLPENIPPQKLSEPFRIAGRSEIQNHSGALADILANLSDATQRVIRDLTSADENVRKYLSEIGLTHFSNEVDKLIERIHSLKNQFQLFYHRINRLGNFTLQVDLARTDKLDAELIRMTRLMTTTPDAKTLLNHIRTCLSNTRADLEWLKDELRDPTIVARNIKNELNHLLEYQLENFSDNYVDLTLQLKFRGNLKGLNLETKGIETVLNREIDKDFGKAKSELLTIAEALLYQNRKDLLPAVAKGFWAVFFVECRNRKENPLPAWEGIRLVREIRKPKF